MSWKHFKVSIDQKIAHVAFNRPDKANALHMEAWDEMKAIFDELSENDGVRVVVLSGEGKHFCAGIDLELLMSISHIQQIECGGKRGEKLRKFVLHLQACVNAIEACAKPVLAAIHNGCIGGGVDIAVACDMRYSTQDAYFTVKEIDLGMVADLGTLQRLPKLIAPGLAAEMAYTGRKVSGTEAQSIGLVNRAFETPEDMKQGVMQVAAAIASKSPVSIRGIKEVLKYTRDHSVADSLDQMATWNAAMILSADLQEAFKATMERRQPQFED